MQTNIFVKLTNDVMFKYVFSHKEVLEPLLKAFFDYIGTPKKFGIVKVYKDYPIYGNNFNDKVFYGDIVAVLDTGEIVSIEMYTGDFGKEQYLKSASYTSRIFSHQLKKGDAYIKAKKVYSINFMVGNYCLENSDIVNEYGFVRKISNPDLNNEFINMFLVRLDLISKMVYNINDKYLIRWGKFMNSENWEELNKFRKDDDAMEQSALYVEEFLKENGTTFQDKITYEKNVSHYEGREEGLEEGRVEGRAEGLKEGRAEGRAEGLEEGMAKGMAKGKKENAISTAQNMLLNNEDVSKISKYTNLTIEEIEALR